ncbi:ankyrin repeat and SOCS box protein 3 isoform X3 [Leucoraja erinacea]|uniref:ankyrin repeat and SOCS box protein 3 isoform X3 n=1 Tax=Leucoraja erinaceus TaxID=7782 RepID=UPI0024562D66|nr:ankyrin repeat and SOCS box protein 3 isoform X3 [Leucoraja erinacea]
MLAMWAGPGGVSAPRLRAGGAVHCWKMDFTEAYSDTCSAAGLAAREGNVELLKALIKKGHSLDIADNRGWYPIHEAASHTTLKCLRLLLHKASLTSGVELKTYEGETALHLAAKHGHLKIVQILLQAGANPNAVTNENVTPLFLAAEKGHIAIVRTLLKNEARINGAHSACLWSLVHQAAYQGHLDVLKFLLEKGADKESKDDYGITPLFLAAQYGKVESLRTLIQHGSNVNCQAYDKATPLFIAAQEGHVECVEVLLSHGVDANLYCNEDDWQLPIHAAAQMGQVKFFAIIYMLLKAGAVITGLHYCYCLQYQCFHLLRFLLEQGYPLPSGAHLAGIVKYGLLSEQQFKQWLPHLLLAGLDPLDLLTEAWLNTAGDRMLHFVLEFTNWKRLPLSVDQIIFCRNASSTCVEQQHFDEIPPLAHLSRLKIRSALESEQLRSDQRIRQLPLPSCLHDFLLYKDVLKLYGIPEISENQEELKTVISSIKNLEN